MAKDMIRTGTDDDLRGGSGNHTLRGGSGSDTLVSGGSNEFLTGGSGADQFEFGADHGKDTITDFEVGVDSISLAGVEDFANEVAISYASNPWAGSPFKANDHEGYEGGHAKVTWAGGTIYILNVDHTLLAAENFGLVESADDGGNELAGADADDTLIGGGGNDTITGLGGDDMLTGGAGNDSLDGGDGDDTLDGGSGFDVLSGGNGADKFVIGAPGADAHLKVITDFEAGIDRISLEGVASFSDLRIQSMEEGSLVKWKGGKLVVSGVDGLSAADFGLSDGGKPPHRSVEFPADSSANDDKRNADGDLPEGGSAGDSQTAGAGNNTLKGGDGADTLIGGAESGTISGLGGDDMLTGGAGNDSLDGGDGDDTLDGGSGFDVLSGGNGADKFVIGAPGADAHLKVITDFEAGIDRISLEGVASFSDLRIQSMEEGSLVKWKGGKLVVSGVDGLSAADFGLSDGGKPPHRSVEFPADSSANGGQRNAADDLPEGGSAGDSQTTGAGSNTLKGGDGADTLTGGAESDTISGLGGDDTLTGGAGEDELRGGDGADLLKGGAGNDSLDGGDGDDTLDGGSGFDVLSGGNGADRFVIGAPGADAHLKVITDFESGADRISLEGVASFSDLRIQSMEEGSLVKWKGGKLVVIGIDGLSAADFGLSDGGKPPHRSVEFPADSSANDGQQDAVGVSLQGGSARDLLIGGSGSDAIEGGGGADTLAGGAGDDTLKGGGGADVFVFRLGSGDDVIRSFNLRADWLGIDAALWTGQRDQAGMDARTSISDSGDLVLTLDDGSTITFAGIASNKGLLDRIRFASEDSSIPKSGDSDNDLLIGGSGGDTIEGGGGEDTMAGGAGNDTLKGGGGADVFVFRLGFGNDMISEFDLSVDRVEIEEELWAGEQRDQAGMDARTSISDSGDLVLTLDDGSTITFAGIASNEGLLDCIGVASDFGHDARAGQGEDEAKVAKVLGSGKRNALDGGEGKDSIWGGSGDDTLHGGAGDDTLKGGSDDDLLFGGDGDDSLISGSGNDTLDGGAGNDVLHGGIGAKVFVFGGGDVIVRFEDGLDSISVAGAGGFVDLEISEAGGNATVEWNGETMTLQSFDHSLLDADDFIFG